MAYTKSQIEALKNSLLASAQPTKINAVKHRQFVQAVIDELFDQQTRANLLALIQDAASAQEGDQFVVIRSGEAFLVPFNEPILALASVDTSGATVTLDFGGKADMAFKGSVNISGNKAVVISNDTNAKQVRYFKFQASAGITLTFESDVRHGLWDGAWDSETGLVWTAPADGVYIMKASRADSLWFVEISGPYPTT